MSSILLFLCILLCSTVQSACTKQYGKKYGDVVSFNAVKAVSACLLFALLSVWQLHLHIPTLTYSLAYGISLSISFFSGYRALRCGPMALTSMLVSFSVCIPMLYGLIVLKEMPSALNILGFAALAVTILLVGLGAGKMGGASQRPSASWFLFVALTFVTNGVCSILQKAHQDAYEQQFLMEFMTFAMLVPAVVFVGWRLLSRRRTKQRGGVFLGLSSGVTNGIACYATLALAGREGATVLFPAISAGTVLLSLLCGFLVFRERPRPVHFAALALGVTAVVLLKI